MLASAASQTSTADRSPLRTASRQSRSESSPVAATYPMTRGTWNRPAWRAGVRRVGQRVGAVERRADDVVTVGGVRRHDAGRGRDAGRVDALHLLGVGEDVRQLAGEEVDFLVVELEVRERGDGFDLGTAE